MFSIQSIVGLICTLVFMLGFSALVLKLSVKGFNQAIKLKRRFGRPSEMDRLPCPHLSVLRGQTIVDDRTPQVPEPPLPQALLLVAVQIILSVTLIFSSRFVISAPRKDNSWRFENPMLEAYISLIAGLVTAVVFMMQLKKWLPCRLLHAFAITLMYNVIYISVALIPLLLFVEIFRAIYF